MTARYSFLNERLAKYYGIEGVSGNEFRRVELPADSHRGGLLTQGSFLVSTSNPDRTSPVKRGLFVLENLLATQPPAPPANVPALEDAKVDGRPLHTVVEQLAAHCADPGVRGVPRLFRPDWHRLGELRWAGPLARAGERRGDRLHVDHGDRRGISWTRRLRDYIVANKERYYRCCAEKLMTYAWVAGLSRMTL